MRLSIRVFQESKKKKKTQNTKKIHLKFWKKR